MSQTRSRPLSAWLSDAARLLKAGHPAQAIEPLYRAAALAPDDPLIQHDLGLACLEADRPDEAEAALRRAVAGRPAFTDAWFRLGIALEAQGQSAPAVVAYDRATALLPSHAEAWFRAGALVFTLGHHAEAIGCFRRAASAGPKTGFGRLGAARACLAEGRDAEAERLLRRLLALEPRHAMALDLLGNLLAEAGRFEEARTCFAAAIASAPRMAGSYYDLVRCRRVTAEDADLIARMGAALEDPAIAGEPRQRIHLALGKAADDLGDYGLAMRHFDAADTLRQRTAPFDAAAFDAQVNSLIDRCWPTPASPEPRAGTPAPLRDDTPAPRRDDTPAPRRDDTPAPRRDDTPTPLLIVGLPRSGTTLVEQIVSSHPDVAAGGELAFWTERGAAWMRTPPGTTDPAFLAEAAHDYLAALRAIGPGARAVTDKMPFNLLWVGLVHAACPNAVFLYCRRHPVDTALSIHQTHFNPRFGFPTGGAALVSAIRATRRLAAHWRRVLPPGRFVEIDYEALTQAPEPSIRRIIAACGLGWNDACLHPEQNARMVRTPSRWQARQKIYRHAVERWRGYEPWLGPLRDLLDTPADSLADSLADTLAEQV